MRMDGLNWTGLYYKLWSDDIWMDGLDWIEDGWIGLDCIRMMDRFVLDRLVGL
jgi:hypothetical protein